MADSLLSEVQAEIKSGRLSYDEVKGLMDSLYEDYSSADLLSIATGVATGESEVARTQMSQYLQENPISIETEYPETAAPEEPAFLSYQEPEQTGLFASVGEVFGYGPQTPVEEYTPDDITGDMPAGDDIEEVMEREESGVTEAKEANPYDRPSAINEIDPTPATPGFMGDPMGGLFAGGAEAFAPTTAYYHREPTYEQAVEFFAKDPNYDRRVAALRELRKNRDNIKKSERYQEFSDLLWMRVHDTFQKTGEPAYRVEKMDPGSANYAIAQTLGKMGPKVEAAAAGSDALWAITGARQMAGAIPVTQGEQLLIDEGLLPQIPDKISRAVEDNPFSFMGGALVSLLPWAKSKHPVAAGARAIGEMVRRQPKLGEKLVRGGVMGGALALGTGAAEGAITAGGEKARGLDVSAEEIVRQAAEEGVLSAGTELATLGIVEPSSHMAKKAHDWLLEDSPVASLLQGIRIGGGSGWTKPPGLKEAQVRARPLRDPSKPTAAVVTGEDLMAKEMPPAIMEVADYEFGQAMEKMGKENRAMYKWLGNRKTDSSPVLDAIEDAVEQQLGRPPSIEELLDLESTLEKSAFPWIDKRILSDAYRYFMANRTIGPKQMDDGLKRLEDQIYQSKGARDAAGFPDRDLKVLQRGLREARKGFGPGYADMKAQHSKIITDIGTAKFEMGIPGENIDLKSAKQQAAVKEAMLSGHGPSKMYGENIAKFQETYPKLAQKIKDLQGAKSWTQYTGRAFGGIDPHPSLGWVARRVPGVFDPVFDRMSKMKGVETGTAAERLIPATGSLQKQWGSGAERRARHIRKVPQEQIDKMLKEIYGRR